MFNEILQIRRCPHCHEPVSKDEKCDKVICPKCSNEFNFCCGSRRTPVTEHGNHYHRPSCRHFTKDNIKLIEEGKEKDVFKQNCSEC